jgi:hypothetical protein
MPNITIDEKNYEFDSLPEEAKAQINMLLATDQKLAELQRDLAIAQTARAAYARALSEVLPKPDN